MSRRTEEGYGDEEEGNVHNTGGLHFHSPLTPAGKSFAVALAEALRMHHESLAWVEAKVKKAREAGQFQTIFTLSDVSNLNAVSHKEYRAFIDILTVHGYSAKMQIPHGQPNPTSFTAQTVIILEFVPKT